MIDKLGLIKIVKNRILLARSKGKDTFYVPGGKRESGESDEVALSREIREELNLDLIDHSIKFLGEFNSIAHGHMDEQVKIRCYSADYNGVPLASSEIEELVWYTPGDRMKISEATLNIIDWLLKNDYLKKNIPTDSVVTSPIRFSRLSNGERTMKSISRYKWLLFDADGTLFPFDSKKALEMVFAHYGHELHDDEFHAYQTLNKSLWRDYQRGLIDANTIKIKRFEQFTKVLGADAITINSAFLNAIKDTTVPLPGVISSLEKLSKTHKIGLITNGFDELQHVRLKHTGLSHHFDVVITSETVGFAKPDPKIFNHTLAMANITDKTSVLMIGDTLESDILGGINAGIDTCWFNPESLENTSGIKANYEIKKIPELHEILGVEDVKSDDTIRNTHKSSEKAMLHG